MDPDFEISQDMILTGDLSRENIERLQENLNPRVIRLGSIARSEANAPEILPYEEELVDDITEAIRNQRENIESIQTNSGSKFTVELYKMDLDRVQYMLKKYLRTRVLKIERQLSAIMANIEMLDSLSPKEKKFAAELHQLNKTYFDETINKRLGEIVREEFVKADDFYKHCQPDYEGFVICRALRDCVDVEHFVDDESENFKTFEKGEIFIIKYRCIHEYLKAGHLELL